MDIIKFHREIRPEDGVKANTRLAVRFHDEFEGKIQPGNRPPCPKIKGERAVRNRSYQNIPNRQDENPFGARKVPSF